MNTKNLTEYAIKGLEAEITALDTKRTMLQQQLQALRAPAAHVPRRTNATAHRKPTISPEGRQRIAEAQRARWAKVKATKARLDKKKAVAAAPAKGKRQPAMAAPATETQPQTIQ